MTLEGDAVVRVLWLFCPAYVANMSPVLVRRFDVLAGPIDGGRTFRGRRILGDHKTWRGIVSGVVSGTLVYEVQRALAVSGLTDALNLIDYARHPIVPGMLLGLGTGVGDAVKSFFKRRVGLAPGASWPPFDQLDFFFGASLFVAPIYVPPLLPTLAALPIVLVGSVGITTVAWMIGMKESWL